MKKLIVKLIGNIWVVESQIWEKNETGLEELKGTMRLFQGTLSDCESFINLTEKEILKHGN